MERNHQLASKPVAMEPAEQVHGNGGPYPHTLIKLITLLALLMLWQLVATMNILPPLYLPDPHNVVAKLWDVTINGYMGATLWEHLSASLGRIGLGLLAAIVLGVPLGLAIGQNGLAHAILDPVIEVYRPVPPLAYLPLIVIWFGIEETAKVVPIFLAILAPIVVATAAGVRKVDPTLIRATRSLGGSSWQTLRFVILPGAVPDILTGIRIGLGTGWSTLVAAELVAANRGLGFMIQSASQFLITDLVVGGIVIIALVAYGLDLGLRWMQRLIAPWEGKPL